MIHLPLTLTRVKVGDKIDLIGECSLMDDNRIFFIQ